MRRGKSVGLDAWILYMACSFCSIRRPKVLIRHRKLELSITCQVTQGELNELLLCIGLMVSPHVNVLEVLVRCLSSGWWIICRFSVRQEKEKNRGKYQPEPVDFFVARFQRNVPGLCFGGTSDLLQVNFNLCVEGCFHSRASGSGRVVPSRPVRDTRWRKIPFYVNP